MIRPVERDEGEAAPGVWYHTIELPAGPTAGEYDLRPSVAKLPFPATLAGKRCLDVGTHDGFWAFQMEQMGAAEVVACDIEDPDAIDWPEPRPVLTTQTLEYLRQRKVKFHIAHEALSSQVIHQYVSVYDLSPDLVGTFDFVHVGSLLHHLRDPVGALMAMRRVTKGELLVSAAVSVSKTALYRSVPITVLSESPGEPFWQTPNLAGLRRQVQSAGFEILSRGPIHLQRRGGGSEAAKPSLGFRDWRGLPGRLLYRVGVPHVGLLARPLVP